MSTTRIIVPEAMRTALGEAIRAYIENYRDPSAEGKAWLLSVERSLNTPVERLTIRECDTCGADLPDDEDDTDWNTLPIIGYQCSGCFETRTPAAHKAADDDGMGSQHIKCTARPKGQWWGFKAQERDK